ncbi:MAG: penicillin-binding protein, partial [Aquaspirillum sp.]
MFARLILGFIAFLLTLVILAAGAAGVAIAVTYPKLPSLDVLTDYRPKIPLRVYTSDGVQIGEFGEEKRAFTRIQDVPQLMKQAILAAEDE